MGTLETAAAPEPLARDPRRALDSLYFGVRVPRQAELALQAAAQDDYTVDMAGKKIAGKKRLVVLLGEYHAKTEKSSAIGKEVLRHFRHRGIEQKKISHWSDRLLSKLQKLSLRRLARENPAGRVRGTTIDDAQANEDLFLNFMSPKDLRQLATEINAMPAEDLSSVAMMGGDRAITWLDLKRFLADKGYMDPRSLPPGPVIYKLEAGHKPGFFEKAGVLAFSFVIVNEQLRGSILTQHAVFKPAAIASAVASAVADRIGVAGVVQGRDQTMAANIRKYLEEDSSLDLMLAIMGQAHTPGVKKLLVKKHGFKGVPFAP